MSNGPTPAPAISRPSPKSHKYSAPTVPPVYSTVNASVIQMVSTLVSNAATGCSKTCMMIDLEKIQLSSPV